MYKGKLVKYYDEIHNTKNYHKECKFIKDNASLDRVLDIRCGTGTHLQELSNDENYVCGIDLSGDMIDLANTKFDKLQGISEFYKCDISEHNGRNYTTIISMFNIINHLLNLDDLNSFFKNTSERLSAGGKFIFDCYNAPAVFNSHPIKFNRNINSLTLGNIFITSVPFFDAMQSNLKLINNTKIFYIDEQVDEFDYSLEYTIWTPKLLTDIITQNNMEVETIVSNKNYKSYPTIDDYKITFVCKKGVF
tara:strand:+ start:932 stop:1678 length:747 start_codon:yes stop_codon:yes gene_type:complete